MNSAKAFDRTSLVPLYTEAKFILFPCGKPGKPKAARQGWQSTKYDAGLTAKKLPEAYGVLLQDDDFVLDVDPRRFAPGDNELQRLWELLKLPSPIQTYMVATASGGSHIYFKKPPGFNVKRRLSREGFGGIEIKSKNQLVIAAGSIVNGVEYRVTRLDPTKVMSCPPELLKFCERIYYSDIDDIDEIEVDDVATRQRYIRYLMSLNAVTKGPGTYQAACEGIDYGLPDERVFELLNEYFNQRTVEPKTDSELRKKVSNASNYGQNPRGRYHPNNDFKDVVIPKTDNDLSSRTDSLGDAGFTGQPFKVMWDIEVGKGGKQVLKSTMSNALNFFVMESIGDLPNPLRGLLRYNLFSNRIEFTRPAPWHDIHTKYHHWTDTDTVMLRLFLSKVGHFNAGNDIINDAVTAAGQLQKYHPLREWLNNLRWDGIRRLDTWMVDYLGAAANKYTSAVGRCTILALVARIYKPGCQHDHMPVLEGEQGSGKSTSVRILGGEHYADIRIRPDKVDTVDGMQGKWVLEASEMAFMRQSEMNSLKAFLTRTTDRVRLSYGRHSLDLPRQSGFIGTVNPDSHGYLTDITGNRRFWPVRTGKIDNDALARDRAQLFAEAVVRHKAGEEHYFTDKEVIALARLEQSKRVSTDEWTDMIERYIASAEENLTTENIAFFGLGVTPNLLTQPLQQRVARCMEVLGYVKERGTWVENWMTGV